MMAVDTGYAFLTSWCGDEGRTHGVRTHGVHRTGLGAHAARGTRGVPPAAAP